MLQRRQQCETIRAESTPALEARRLVTTLAGVVGIGTPRWVHAPTLISLNRNLSLG